MQGRDYWQGAGGSQEGDTREQLIHPRNTDDDGEEDDSVGTSKLTENQGTFDFSDEDIEEENESETKKSIEQIESYTFEESKTNNAPKRYKRGLTDPLEAQPKFVAPEFNNSQSKTKGPVESTDLESHLKVKLQAKSLQFELENSGLNSFEQTRRWCVAAAEAFMGGKVKSIKTAADYFNINQHTLIRGLKRGHFNKRPGIPTKAFTKEEEKKLVAYIRSLDFEVTWKQIGLAIQESLLDITKNNPERKTGMEKTGQVPHGSWVRRFADRHGLKPIKSLQCKKDDGPGRFMKWQKINYKTNKLYNTE